MVLALRAALVQADWTTIAAFLLGSFGAHGVELALRLRPLSQPNSPVKDVRGMTAPAPARLPVQERAS